MDMLKDLSLEEIIEQLTRIKNTAAPNVKEWKVRIGWTNGRKSCVGKIIGVAKDNTRVGTVYLFPAPENIETLNTIFDMIVSLTCDKRQTIKDCTKCEEYMTCEHVTHAEESIKSINEGTKNVQN